MRSHRELAKLEPQSLSAYAWLKSYYVGAREELYKTSIASANKGSGFVAANLERLDKELTREYERILLYGVARTFESTQWYDEQMALIYQDYR